MPKNETVRSYKDYYILKFEDDNYKIAWKVGNLARFLRNMFNDNQVLRDTYPKHTAKSFAEMTSRKMRNNLLLYKNKNGVNAAPFYLVPYGHPSRLYYMGLIERRGPSSSKCLQD